MERKTAAISTGSADPVRRVRARRRSIAGASWTGRAKFAVGGMTAAMLLDALNPKFAEAQQVAKDDARLTAEYVELLRRRRATAR